MCFFLFSILLLLLSVPLILCAYKTLLFSAPAFLPFKTTPYLSPQVGLAAHPRWLFMFPPFCWLKSQFYLPSFIGLTLLPLTCSGSACLVNHSPTSVF